MLIQNFRSKFDSLVVKFFFGEFINILLICSIMFIKLTDLVFPIISKYLSVNRMFFVFTDQKRVVCSDVQEEPGASLRCFTLYFHFKHVCRVHLTVVTTSVHYNVRNGQMVVQTLIQK